MDWFLFIPNHFYQYIYISLVVSLSLLTGLSYLSSTDNKILLQNNRGLSIGMFIICVILAFFLGLRPHTYYVHEFGDTYYYYHSFQTIENYMSPSLGTEWLWNNLNLIFRDAGDVNGTFFFLFVELLYIGFMFLACYKLTRQNLWISMIFCLVSFSFYGYAINGLRNGLACSIMMLAIALFTGNNCEKFLSIFLMIAAYSIHNSIILPILCLLASCTLRKDTKFAIGFWIASIFLSLIIGNLIGDFFSNLGFDDRASYFSDASESEYAEQFSSTGFRFDFLLYSAVPVLMVWYLTVKRSFKDFTYNIIANTYIFANAFWIMVIRATYSNRFAYLSWFLYPIVIAYPLIRMNVWKDQDRKAALILLAYAGFTFVLFLLK